MSVHSMGATIASPVIVGSIDGAEIASPGYILARSIKKPTSSLFASDRAKIMLLTSRKSRCQKLTTLPTLLKYNGHKQRMTRKVQNIGAFELPPGAAAPRAAFVLMNAAVTSAGRSLVNLSI